MCIFGFLPNVFTNRSRCETGHKEEPKISWVPEWRIPVCINKKLDCKTVMLLNVRKIHHLWLPSYLTKKEAKLAQLIVPGLSKRVGKESRNKRINCVLLPNTA